MRAAQILNGKVVNIVDVPSLNFIPGLVDASNNGGIGDTWDGAQFSHPAPLPAGVPQSITMCQARLALLAAGLIASVNSAVANLTGPTAAAAQTQWAYSALVHRNDALVLSMGAALGLTSAQLDALFIAGALL